MRDHLEIRRRALRAAAAAAGLSALSCSDGAAGGGAQTADVGVNTDVGAVQDAADAAGADAADTTSADAGSADAASADTASADAASADTASADTASADAASADAGADTASADTAGCAPLGDGEPDCKALQGDPSWATCCDDHLAYCVALHGADTPATNDCHFGPDFSGQCTGCIPWGPPAPPRFDVDWRPRVVGNGAIFEVV